MRESPPHRSSAGPSRPNRPHQSLAHQPTPPAGPGDQRAALNARSPAYPPTNRANERKKKGKGGGRGKKSKDSEKKGNKGMKRKKKRKGTKKGKIGSEKGVFVEIIDTNPDCWFLHNKVFFSFMPPPRPSSLCKSILRFTDLDHSSPQLNPATQNEPRKPRPKTTASVTRDGRTGLLAAIFVFGYFYAGGSHTSQVVLALCGVSASKSTAATPDITKKRALDFYGTPRKAIKTCSAATRAVSPSFVCLRACPPCS